MLGNDLLGRGGLIGMWVVREPVFFSCAQNACEEKDGEDPAIKSLEIQYQHLFSIPKLRFLTPARIITIPPSCKLGNTGFDSMAAARLSDLDASIRRRMFSPPPLA